MSMEVGQYSIYMYVIKWGKVPRIQKVLLKKLKIYLNPLLHLELQKCTKKTPYTIQYCLSVSCARKFCNFHGFNVKSLLNLLAHIREFNEENYNQDPDGILLNPLQVGIFVNYVLSVCSSNEEFRDQGLSVACEFGGSFKGTA